MSGISVCSPTVAVDIAAPKQFERIDVDFDKLSGLVNAAGISEEDQNGVDILLSTTKGPLLYRRNFGRFIPPDPANEQHSVLDKYVGLFQLKNPVDTPTVVLNLMKIREYSEKGYDLQKPLSLNERSEKPTDLEDNTVAVLAHELFHYKDYVSDSESYAQRMTAIRKNNKYFALFQVGALALGLSIVESQLNPTELDTSQVAFAGTIISATAVGMFFRGMNPIIEAENASEESVHERVQHLFSERAEEFKGLITLGSIESSA